MGLRSSLAVVLVAALIVVPVVAGTVGASPQPTANDTTSAADSPDSDEVTSVVARIDEDLRVTAYGYDEGDGVFWIEIENTRDRPSAVTVSGVIDAEGAGAGSVAIRQYVIRPGTERVRIDLGPDSERAVTITSRKSLDQGRGVYLSKEPNDNPFSAFGGTSGVLAGIGTAVSFSLVAAWFVVWRESDGVEVAG